MMGDVLIGGERGGPIPQPGDRDPLRAGDRNVVAAGQNDGKLPERLSADRCFQGVCSHFPPSMGPRQKARIATFLFQ